MSVWASSNFKTMIKHKTKQRSISEDTCLFLPIVCGYLIYYVEYLYILYSFEGSITYLRVKINNR